MKKIFYSFILLGLLCEGCVNDLHIQDGVVKTNILRRSDDFRKFFCSQIEIQMLEKNSACLLIEGKTRQQIKIASTTSDKGVSLRDMLPPYLTHYSGQKKVISRNHIVQTSFGEDDSVLPENIFVKPGDLIVICPRD